MNDDISEQELLDQWEDTATTLRTRAVVSKILLVLSHMTLTGNGTVAEMRELLNEMVSDPQKGVRLILKFDPQLNDRLELHRTTITETFIQEINDAIDLFKPGRDSPLPDNKPPPDDQPPSDPYTRIENGYSRLYGKDSAWN